ncbi:MAG: hypothetical protein WDZ38_01670 [Balneolaceae bacterium]
MSLLISTRISCNIVVSFLLFYLSSSAWNVLTAQDHQKSVQFVQTFNGLQQELPRERVYLHTDRDWYFSGDRIWLSAYSVAGSRHFPSELSTILYVELFQPDGTLQERIVIKLDEGRGSGSFEIEPNINQSGTYLLTAYTAWGKNFGDSYVFKKKLMIYTDSEELQPAIADNDAFDLQFFPESGHLIGDIPTRLAFKAIGSNGLGRNVSGTIYNSNGNEEAHFESEHLGMGVIEFTPAHDEMYYAIVYGARFELPEVQPAGYLMNLSQISDFITVNVHTGGIAEDVPLLLFAHVRGEVFYASLMLIEDGIGELTIPMDQFAGGIIHFTLLNPQGQPAAERLFYNINPVEELQIELNLNNESPGFRTETEIALQLHDSNGQSMTADASLTIYDDQIVGYQSDGTNIYNWLNLQSEIKGVVEKPGFYFSDDEKAGEYLDLLMLTQGWRAYDYERIMDPVWVNEFTLPEKGFTISGSVTSLIRNRPFADASVLFSIGSDHHEIDLITTDENGRFRLTDLQIEGAELVTVKANTSSGSDRVAIEIDNQFEHLGTSNYPIHQQIRNLLLYDDSAKSPEELLSPLNERVITVQTDIERFVDAQMFGELDEITVEAEREETDDQFERDLRFGDRPLQRVDFDERPELADVPLLIAINQMPGVSATEQHGLSINTGSANLTVLPAPIIIVDDIETDFSSLLAMSSMDIQSINVFRRSSELGFFGARGAGGVLMVRTRSGGGVQGSDTRGLITSFVQGYQPPSQFYSPKYGITVPRDLEQEDSRITLHWEDRLEIPETGRTIRFWTNDIPSNYRIVFEGITETGIPFFKTEVFTVSDD